jgi:amino acid transporter
VQEPERTFPKAMGWAIVMVIVTNVVPVLNASAAFADPDYSLWVDGFFATAARQIGGEWLSVWIVAGAASSNIGLFEAEMSSDSLQIQGMAENGMLPRFLSKRSRFGTPLIATLMSAVGALSLSFFEFSELLEVLNFMYCLGQLLEFAAFLHLRITQPDLVRPWRIPLGTAMCAVCLVPATTFILALMVISKRETKYICLSIVVSGFVLHWLLGIARRNHWCEFNELVVNGQACGTAVEYVMTDEISTTSREDEEEDGL